MKSQYLIRIFLALGLTITLVSGQLICPSSSHQKTSGFYGKELSLLPETNVLVIPVAYQGIDSKLPPNWGESIRRFDEYIKAVSRGKHNTTTRILAKETADGQVPYKHPLTVQEAKASVWEYHSKVGKVHADILWQIYNEQKSIFDDVVMIFFVHLGNVFDGYTGYGRIGDISSFPYYKAAGAGVLDLRNMDINFWNMTHEYGHLMDLWHPPNNGSRRHYGVYNIMENSYVNDGFGDNVTPFHPKDLMHIGWVDTVEVITTTQTGVELPVFENSGKLIKIPVSPTMDEYFLLGNYSGKGPFGRYRGNGILLWHIKGSSVQDVEMPSGLWKENAPNPIAGDDLLDSVNYGYTGSQSAFWTPELGRDFSPLTNPSTARYSGYSRYDQQSVASGVFIQNLRWSSNNDSTIILDIFRDEFQLVPIVQTASASSLLKIGNGSEIFAQGQVQSGSQSMALVKTSDMRLMMITESESHTLAMKVLNPGGIALGGFGKKLCLTVDTENGKRGFYWENGQWRDELPLDLPDLKGHRVDLVDLNDDGYQDLAKFFSRLGKADSLSVRFGGDAAYQAGFNMTLSGNSDPKTILYRDLNGDAKPDLLSSRGIYLYTNTGFEKLGNEEGLSGFMSHYPYSGISTGDYNGDGYEDILAVSEWNKVVFLANMDGKHFTDMSSLFNFQTDISNWSKLEGGWKLKEERLVPYIQGKDQNNNFSVYELPALTSTKQVATLNLIPPSSNPFGLGTKLRLFDEKGLVWTRDFYLKGPKLDELEIAVPVSGATENSLLVEFYGGKKLLFSRVEPGEQIIADAVTSHVYEKPFESKSSLKNTIDFQYDASRNGFKISSPSKLMMRLDVFNLDGSRIGTWYGNSGGQDGKYVPASEIKRGGLPAGAYLARLNSGTFTDMSRFIIRN